MNGIKMSDCKFYVNEEKRTVVCVIPNTKYLFLNFVEGHFSFEDIDMDFAIKYGKLFRDKQILMPNCFIGKAVCSDEDDWNEELGRKLAYSRAKDKCYKSFFKRANMVVQTLDYRLNNMITTFNDFGLKLEDRRERLETQIESMTQKE